MSATMVRISYEDSKPFHAAMHRERVSTKDSLRKTWYGVMVNGELVGVGFILNMGRFARIGGIWLKPEVRGRGLGSFFTRFLLNNAKKAGVQYIDAFPLRPQWYLQEGFEIVGRNAHGVARVILRLK